MFETLKLECKPLVIDAEQAEDSGVEIADVDRVFHDVIAKVVGHAVGDSGFGAASGHPDRKATRMMVAAIVVFGKAALAVNSAAEFAAPEYERVVEELGGAIRRGTKFWQVADGVGVDIPTALIDLRESNTTFGHTAREQTIVGKRACLLCVVAI